jgi:glycosyltransferase involved in cell wall biosynthesis
MDSTEKIIDQLISNGMPIEKVNIPTNDGYGNGILEGLKQCRGHYVGFLCADGQVAPQDVVQVFRLAQGNGHPCLAKVRRKFRPDGLIRKVVSICFNGLISCVFFGLHSLDINGNPKIFPYEMLHLFLLSSKNWFLDAEIMIKAKVLNIPVVEMNVKGQFRQGGKSHVRVQTSLEFFKSIYQYRLGHPIRQWQKNLGNGEKWDDHFFQKG